MDSISAPKRKPRQPCNPERVRAIEDAIIRELTKSPDAYTVCTLARDLGITPNSLDAALLRIERGRGIATVEDPYNGRLALYQDYGDTPYAGSFAAAT